MSTSVYRSEQLVHYRYQDPATYFGFYVSWSGGEDDSAYPFSNAERREDWVKAVRAALPERDEYDTDLAAGMLACAVWGPESSRDAIAYAFDEMYGDDAEGLHELAARFDPSEPPGTPLAPEVPL